MFGEPTNDLDIDTLTVLEDFLDGWPGTLVVVSHDRYFLERVTDSIWALMGDGKIAMLPRGVDEYLERRSSASADVSGAGETGGRESTGAVSGRELHEAKKEMSSLERRLSRLQESVSEEHAKLGSIDPADHVGLAARAARIGELEQEISALEERWLELYELSE